MYRTRRLRDRARVHVRVVIGRLPRASSDEVADQQVGEHRVAARDHVVGALDDDERRPGAAPRARARARGAGSGPRCRGRGASGSGCRRSTASTDSCVELAAGAGIGEHRVDRPVARPLDGVVDDLRRVRLGGDRREEEAREVRVVPEPGVAVDLGPALVRPAARRRTRTAPSTGAAARGTGRRPRTRRCRARAPGRSPRAGPPARPRRRTGRRGSPRPSRSRRARGGCRRRSPRTGRPRRRPAGPSARCPARRT